MKKVRLRLWVIIVIFLLCLTGVIYYSYKVIEWKLSVEENKKIQDEIKDNVTLSNLDNKPVYNIDFESLKKRNEDAIAYIKVNNTNIAYIVVKGSDNKYYLNHNFDKNYNVAGWVFGDFHNKFDGSDKNLIIYGHNTKDGSMFDTLIDVLNKEWYENKDNYEVVLVTEKGTSYYEVFSTYSIVPEDYYINTIFKDNDEFGEFVKKLKSRSVYDYGVEVTGNDKILTLSSCIGDGRERVVLHAKLKEF